MIRAVVFDIDDTLYDYRKANRTGLESAWKVMSEAVSMSFRNFREMRNEMKLVIGHQSSGPVTHNKCIQFQLMLEELGIFDAKLVLDMWNAYQKNFFSSIKRDRKLSSLFRRLSKNYLIGILTNHYTDHQLEVLAKLGVGEYIDAFISSEEISMEKPSRIPFITILWKLGVRPDESVYVADREDDMYGACMTGMKAIALGMASKCADASIRDIYGVENALKEAE